MSEQRNVSAVASTVMRVLVTGSGGFVGGHLCAHLEAMGDEVVAWSGGAGSPDITDPAALRHALRGESFDAVVHLAAQSRVDLSWSEPAQTMAVNAGGTANVIEALAESGGTPRLLVMSSAEVYGLVDESMLPVDETTPLQPRTPYGVSKVASEHMALLLGAQRGLDVIVCRPFNQIGPGQAPNFVAAAFAGQVAANERAGGGVIEVGNLSATRDFLDVRDAVQAYRLLLTDGAAGEIYNVAAGREAPVSSLLDGLLAASSVAQEVVVDEARFRPNDLARMYGSSAKLTAQTGWEPQRELDETLADVLEEWRARGVADGAGDEQ